ncbi:hypothetical protein KDK88_05485, partial [bacterium]|nr:hypothetical protein [bacterium]
GGSFPVELGGVRVLVGGVAAPLLFVSPNQINAVTPSGLGDGELASVMLEGGAPSNVLSLTSIPALPVSFQSGDRQVIALDQEGRLITEQNPVKRGEIAVVWATAVGAMAPEMADGAVAPLEPPFPQATGITGVTVDDVPAQILYAGAAPGLVAGVAQVNFVVPEGNEAGERFLRLLTGDGEYGIAVRIWVE